MDPLILKLKALADETRHEILKALIIKKQTVGDITKKVNRSQPNVSIALRHLLHSGIIDQERDGRSIYYFVKNPAKLKKIYELLDSE